jgi:histidine ammonia-lyase
MAAKAFTIGGIGAQPTLDDVVKIAQGGITVALDAAGAERVKKESPPPKSFQPESFEPPSASNAASAQLLDVSQTRAVLATRLLTIMNGRSGTRVQVAEFLVSLLNSNILPALPAAPADAAVLSHLADACYGSGATILAPSPAAAAADGHVPAGSAAAGPALADALAATGLTAPGLSATERVVLSTGSAAAAGAAALAVQGGKKLQTLATATAALSCEVLGVQVGQG